MFNLSRTETNNGQVTKLTQETFFTTENMMNLSTPAKTFAKNAFPMLIMGDIMSLLRSRDVSKLERLAGAAFLLGFFDVSVKSFASATIIQDKTGTSKQPKVQLSKTALAAIFVSIFTLNRAANLLEWNVALYVTLRLLFNKVNGGRLGTFFRHPFGIFLNHCVHNYFVTHQAEYVEPSYLRLWLKVLPGFKNVDAWLIDFGSDATDKTTCPNYKPEQVSKERLEKLPRLVFQTFLIQLPLVATLYILPTIFKLSAKAKTLKFSDVFSAISEAVIKTIRSDLVLMCLPYILLEFPVVYAHFVRPIITKSKYDENGNLVVPRAPLLHTASASVASMLVFYGETDQRLDAMLIYTLWRSVEAVLRKFYLKEGTAIKSKPADKINSQQRDLELGMVAGSNSVETSISRLSNEVALSSLLTATAAILSV